MIKKEFSLFLNVLTPSATIFRASISKPESVSSKIESFGVSIDICRISFFFFSPPEKPTFNCLLSFSSSNFSSLAFSFTSFKNSIASSSFCPRAFLIAFREVFKKILSRQLNVGFSGGEKKKNEILQMSILNPKLSILDETDSGLDIDALRIVSEGVNSLRTKDNSFLIITHYQRLLDYIKPDFVHVLKNGQIIKSGGPELAMDLEKKGYEDFE